MYQKHLTQIRMFALQFLLIAMVFAGVNPISVKAAETEAYAVFDSNDGSLTFFKDEAGKYSNKQVIGTKTYYTGIETTLYNCTNKRPDWEQYNTSVKTVSFEEKIAPISTAKWFSECKNVTSLDLNKLDTTNVTSMASMFENCSNLVNLDLSKFNTSKVTDMERLFFNCSSLNSLNLSHFTTKNVTNLVQAFQNCVNLKDIDVSTFNTQKVTSCFNTFANCNSLKKLDISSFTVESIGDGGIEGMIYGCTSLEELNISGIEQTNINQGTLFSNNSVPNLRKIIISDKNNNIDFSHEDVFKKKWKLVLNSDGTPSENNIVIPLTTQNKQGGTYELVIEHQHTPGEVKNYEKEATCTEAGYWQHTTYCAECGEQIASSMAIIEPLGHDWGEWTTDSDNKEVRICKRCGEKEYRDAAVKTYTITWKNYDGKVLATTVVKEGDMPKYEGIEPTHEGEYTFKGWTPEIVKATDNTTYTAVFAENAVESQDEDEPEKEKSTSSKPKTGDTSNIFLWLIAFAVSGFTTTLLAKKK